ncbi:MAG TPA: CHAD domain-containing protein, partial [Vicinamibacteria bacterium]
MADDTPVRERLEQPVEQATRAVALRLLQKVDGERRRVDDPRDKEALHDFRVALRRLRSWLRAYKAPLRGSVSGKDRDTLRAVARATNAGRDAEVHVEWLRARAEFFRPGRRKGTEWLIKQLQARGRAATETLSKKVSGDFAPLRRKLMDRLKVYTRRVDDASTEVTFAVATSLLVRDHAEALREKIASVRGPRD